MKKTLRGAVRAVLPYILIASYYVLLTFIGVGCPLKFITGVSCPGCGMTRAYLSLLRLDFAGAFAFHPLFPLPPVMIVLYFLKEREKLPRRFWRVLVGLFCAAMIAVWLIRLIPGDGDIVSFHPENSVFARLLRSELPIG